MPVHHPNKQKNPVEKLRAWKPNLHGRALKAWLKRERRWLRRLRRHDPSNFAGWSPPCACNDCERKRDRRLKERPAKDVEAAKLREYRSKRRHAESP